MDTVRNIGVILAITQGGAADYNSQPPVPVAMPSDEAENISAIASFMNTGYLGMLIYYLWFFGSSSYVDDILQCKPSKMIVDNIAAISMGKCNKDTASNGHVT